MNQSKDHEAVSFGLIASESKAVLNGAKADIVARMSPVRGRADLDRNVRNFAC
jgi:hypothetical protein